MQPHDSFRVSNFCLNNHQWLRTNSSLKHHLNLSWLIVARHTNLPMACVLAVTLALLPLKSSLSLFTSHDVLAAFSKWANSWSLLFLRLLPIHSRPPSQFRYHYIWETFYRLIAPIWLRELMELLFIAAVVNWQAAVTLSPSVLSLPALYPNLSIRSCSGSSQCSNCQGCTMNQNGRQISPLLHDSKQCHAHLKRERLFSVHLESHRNKLDRDGKKTCKVFLWEVILHYIDAVGLGSTKGRLGLRSWAERGIREFSHLQTQERNEPCGLCVF